MIKQETFKEFNSKQIKMGQEKEDALYYCDLVDKVFGETQSTIETIDKEKIFEHCNKVLARMLGFTIQTIGEMRKEKNNPGLYPFAEDGECIMLPSDALTGPKWLKHFTPQKNWNQLMKCVVCIEKLMGRRLDMVSEIEVTYSMVVSFAVAQQ